LDNFFDPKWGSCPNTRSFTPQPQSRNHLFLQVAQQTRTTAICQVDALIIQTKIVICLLQISLFVVSLLTMLAMASAVHVWLTAAVWLWLLADYVFATREMESSVSLSGNKHMLVTVLTTALIAGFPQLHDSYAVQAEKKARVACPHRIRKRRSVRSIMEELGPCCTCRAHRMDEPSFLKLCGLLAPHVKTPPNDKWKTARKRRRRRSTKKSAKNGLVSGDSRLSSAIRCFAGGRPEDTCLVHGMSHSEVFNSI